MTTPLQRISRLLNEDAKFMVELPGHMTIDLTPMSSPRWQRYPANQNS